MTKSDTDCIKYLENEMDPSEKIVFEREIESNSDLLIELETIRTIRDKVKNSLPLISAPESVLESVANFSEQHAQKPKVKSIPPYLTAAAAVFVCTITIGIFLIDESGTHQGDVINASFNSEINLPSGISTSETETEAVIPWVDRNQVLHFTGNQDEKADGADPIFQNSYKHLTPVGPANDVRTTQRSFHLTRTSN